MQILSQILQQAAQAGPRDEVGFKSTPDSCGRTVFLADLPRNTTYCDVYNYFKEELQTHVLLTIKR